MLDCELRSGSLKLKRWEEPEASAVVTAASQPEVKVLAMPQSMGTYSRVLGMLPPGPAAQL